MVSIYGGLVSSCSLFFILFNIINQSSSARLLGNTIPGYNSDHQNHQKIAFLMRNVLNVTHPSSLEPPTTDVISQAQDQIPFSKPLGLFPPYRGIPLAQSSATGTVSGSPRQPLDISNTGIPFPIRATLEELELGSITEVEEDLLQETIYGPMAIGKAQGVFVASSEDGTSHMVAMAAVFSSGAYKDGLRFFGVYKLDAPEAHIAVIGGTGKYHGANGYAVIKVVSLDHTGAGEKHRSNQFLLFDIYVS